LPILDDCITNIYEPGNIGADSGTPPLVIRPGTLYSPDDYPIDSVEYSWVFSRFYDSMYAAGGF
jgi:nucleoside-diphosphate-sugar epimerase